MAVPPFGEAAAEEAAAMLPNARAVNAAKAEQAYLAATVVTEITPATPHRTARSRAVVAAAVRTPGQSRATAQTDR